MIGYVTVGTNDLARANKFYDQLFALLGAGRAMEMERFTMWSAGMDKPGFAAIVPFNGEAATVGNGMMISLAVKDPEQVQALYSKAIELGGKSEGEPGPRGDSGFYAAYFRDLDGNKLAAFCMTK